jgi:hypothetical protein
MESNVQVSVSNGANAGVQLYQAPQQHRVPAETHFHGFVVPASLSNAPVGVALPIPAVSESAVGGHEDRRAAKWSWVAYISALGCCCCCPGSAIVFAPCILLVTASMYFCKPEQNRRNFPKQRMAALWSVWTCVVCAMIVWLCTAGIFGFAIGFYSKNPDAFHHNRIEDGVDWGATVAVCPALEAYGSEQCADGPHSCKRDPTEVELVSICKEFDLEPCKEVATETGAKSVFDVPCEQLRETMDRVDWKKTFETCREWGRFASDHCSSGACDREPNEDEFTVICWEFGWQPCRHIAKLTGAARFIEESCRHVLKQPHLNVAAVNETQTVLAIESGKQNIRGARL